MITINIRYFTALGDRISMLSFLLSLNDTVTVTVFNNKYATDWINIVRLFKLEDRITINNAPWNLHTIEDIRQNDINAFKFFSRYINRDKISIFGQDKCINVKNKPCIGLAISGGAPKSKQFFDNIELMIATKDNWQQYHRYHTLATNESIFKLITLAGYDVIVLDALDTSLDHKALMIADLCDCVIGYEGGMMHLAHALKVPSIILPRRYDTIDIMPDIIHLDKMTYFIRDENEILQWTIDDLKCKIRDLKQEKGNNFFFNNNLKLDQESLNIYHDNDIVHYTITSKIVNIVKKYITYPQIGGY